MRNAMKRLEGELWMPGFCLMRTGLVVDGDPTFEQWQECGRAIRYMEGAVQWWIGDWLNDGERHYGESYTRALEATGFEYQTAANYKYVAGRVDVSRRREKLPWSHHAEVAALEDADQDKMLGQAEAEGWTRAQLREAVRTRKRLAARETAGSFPDGTFAVVLADPPWLYEPGTTTANREIDNHYPTLSLEQIRSLQDDRGRPVQKLFAPDCVLFCWTTSPKLDEGMEVVRAWGFTYRTNLVWVKDKIGMGYYARQRHEQLLVAARGNLPVPPPEARPDSVIEAPRGRHSQKPEAVYGLLEAMYPGLPKVELFARGGRPGWAAWGNQAGGQAA
jgi:N6-adenosine-specific RNA methylase IME4